MRTVCCFTLRPSSSCGMLSEQDISLHEENTLRINFDQCTLSTFQHFKFSKGKVALTLLKYRNIRKIQFLEIISHIILLSQNYQVSNLIILPSSFSKQERKLHRSLYPRNHDTLHLTSTRSRVTRHLHNYTLFHKLSRISNTVFSLGWLRFSNTFRAINAEKKHFDHHLPRKQGRKEGRKDGRKEGGNGEQNSESNRIERLASRFERTIPENV